MTTTRIARATAAALLVVVACGQAGCGSSVVLREEGYYALRRGEYALAREKLEAGVTKRPGDYLAHFYLGQAYLKLDRPVDAQLALEKALAVRGHDPRLGPQILDELAEAVYRQDRPEALHALLARTTREYGTSRDFLRQARFMARSGDTEGARLAYRKAAYFARTGDANPYVAMADFYASIEDVPNAVTALRYAYYVDPKEPGIGDRFRKFGIVPGPTVAAAPSKPELMRSGPFRKSVVSTR